MKSLREKIGEVPIFPGLKREDVAKLLDKMEECSFSAGVIIFSQGDTSDAPLPARICGCLGQWQGRRPWVIVQDQCAPERQRRAVGCSAGQRGAGG